MKENPSKDEQMKKKYTELLYQDKIWEEEVRGEIDDYLDQLENLPLQARKFRVRLNKELSDMMTHFSDDQVKRLKNLLMNPK